MIKFISKGVWHMQSFPLLQLNLLINCMRCTLLLFFIMKRMIPQAILYESQDDCTSYLSTCCNKQRHCIDSSYVASLQKERVHY